MSFDEYLINKNDNKINLEKFYNSSDSLIEIIKKFLNSNNIEFKFKKIVDFGCGVGRITNKLSDFGEIVYDIDISENHLQIARSNIKKDNVKFVGYNENYSFPNELNSSNFIVSFIVLQHIRPQEMKYFIENILNILEKDGLLLVA